MNRRNTIARALSEVYGVSSLTESVAGIVDSRWDEFGPAPTDNRDDLMIYLWVQWSGGGTAEIAAGKVREAVDKAAVVH